MRCATLLLGVGLRSPTPAASFRKEEEEERNRCVLSSTLLRMEAESRGRAAPTALAPSPLLGLLFPSTATWFLLSPPSLPPTALEQSWVHGMSSGCTLVG